MPFEKGHKSGGGRPKGSPNKHTAEIKECILEAGHRAGNKHGKDGMTSYLEHQAVENPTAFMGLIAKVIPSTTQGPNADGSMTLRFIMGEEPSVKSD